MPTKTDFNTFARTKQSVSGRLKRLRKINSNWMCDDKESPIAEIGCFKNEIDSMEKTLKAMQTRLNNATVKIPD